MQTRLSCAALSLALYREVAAQVRQVRGVATVDLEAQGMIPFGYQQSQVAALLVTFGSDRTPTTDRQLRTILDYYARTFGQWQTTEP